MVFAASVKVTRASGGAPVSTVARNPVPQAGVKDP